MRKIISILFAVCLVCSLFIFDEHASESSRVFAAGVTPDAVYINGNVLTVDDAFSKAEAFAVKDGKFLEVGKTAQIKALADAKTKVIDLGGKTVMPGMTDTHLHMQRYGLKFIQIDCMDKSKETILEGVTAKVKDFNDSALWIRGSGWNQEIWASPVFPTKEDLDKVSPNNPVALIRSDNHTLWVNTKALELAGITKDTKNPEGGVIRRDASGNATGILIDTAMDLVNSKMPGFSKVEIEKAYENADKVYSKVGLTSVCDAGDNADFDIQKAMIADGRIQTRIYAVMDRTKTDEFFQKGTKPEIGLLDNHFTRRAIKLKADGALGSRGAKLLADYCDAEGVTGNTLIDKETLQKYADRAIELGYQIHAHAIGDKTSRDVIDVFEQTELSGKNVNNALRFGIVHAQVISMQDIPRVGKLNIYTMMQPVHATGDMGMAETRLGPWRILGAYNWRALKDMGVVIGGGSDSPNDYIEPLFGIHAYVTRQNKDNLPVSGWYPEMSLTLQEAIRSYTTDAAKVMFEESIKGSIEKGKLADFVILDQDIMTIPKKDIHKINILETYIGGKEVYKAQ